MTDQLTFEDAVAETNAICALVFGDPIHENDRRAVLAAIQADADANRGEVDPNRVRDRIPSWVYPRVTSSVYRVLKARRVLTFARWGENADAKGRNVGKPQRIYQLMERVA